MNKEKSIHVSNISNERRKKIIIESIESGKDGFYQKHPIATMFYDKKNNRYIAMDNTTHDCWIEEFKTKNEALKWLKAND